MTYRARFTALGLIAAAGWIACTAPPQQSQSDTTLMEGPRAPGAGLLFEKAELEADSGDTAMEFVVKGDTVALYDGRGRKIADYRVAGDAITFDVDVLRGGGSGHVDRRPDEFVISTSNTDLADLSLSREPDGDVRIDRAGNRLFDLKTREYGYKIVDVKGTDLGRVRVGSNSIKVRNHRRQLVRETKAPISTAAVACWVLPDLEVHETGALVLAITVWGLPD